MAPEVDVAGQDIAAAIRLLRAEYPLCSLCSSSELSWDMSVRARPSSPGHNRLSLNDVQPILVLGCDECSETVLIVAG